MGGGLPTDTPSDWPSIARVEKYNRNLREALDEALQNQRTETSKPELADENFAARGHRTSADARGDASLSLPQFAEREKDRDGATAATEARSEAVPSYDSRGHRDTWQAARERIRLGQ